MSIVCGGQEEKEKPTKIRLTRAFNAWCERRDSNSRSEGRGLAKKKSSGWSKFAWCERRDSNSRPLPWQGSALNN